MDVKCLCLSDFAPALIVIDLQTGVVSLPTAHPIKQIVQRAAALAAAFRSHALPVILVNVVGVPPGRTEQSRFKGDLPKEATVLVADLDQQPSDHRVSKRSAGAFTRTDLEAYLLEQGVTQVVIVGVATGTGVEATARQAHELGFNVAFAIDAMTDTDAELHATIVAKVFPRLGERGETAEILDLLRTRRSDGAA